LVALAGMMGVLAGCAGRGVGRVSLEPVPFAMVVPEGIARRLTTGPVEGLFGREVERAGALAARTVYFNPGPGEENLPRSVFLTAFYFPEAAFDAAQNPNEPPSFGQAVVRGEGTVLGIAGPHDTIYDPGTRAGRDVVRLAGRIYESDTYQRIEKP
jgi:hypothetical protein